MCVLNEFKKNIPSDYPGKIKAINLSFLELTFSNDLSLIIPLLKTLQSESKQFVKHISNSLLKKDFTAIAKAAHSMRSTGAYIGSNTLSLLITQLEEAANDSNYNRVRLHMVEIQDELTLILADIDEYLHDKPATE